MYKFHYQIIIVLISHKLNWTLSFGGKPQSFKRIKNYLDLKKYNLKALFLVFDNA